MNQIIGYSRPFKAGRRVYLVSYVSISEWQTYNSLAKRDESLALLELVYYSLHRGDAGITRKQVKKLLRRHVELCYPLIELICEISVPVLKGQKKMVDESPAINNGTDEQDEKNAERNLKTVYRLMSKQYGWTPQQISEMSPAQIYTYQMSGKDGSGIEKMSGAEYQSFRAQRNLGIAKRTQNAQRKIS